MKRRGGASGQPVKRRPPSVSAAKARRASTAPLSIDHTPEEFDCLKRERDETLQQQTATSEVLKVISRSTFDLQTVLDTLTESVTRLCDAYDATLYLGQGDRLHLKAHYGPIPNDTAEWPIGPKWVNGRAFVNRAPVHVYDLQASANEFPDGAEMALRLGHRTILAVPLLRENESIGTIAIRRLEVKPFSEKQIELTETFAAQAVIAIENTRLLSELRESLQQQTATADVLKAISRETFDLPAVLDTLIASACRLCEAEIGTIRHEDGPDYGLAATYGCQPEWRKHFAGYSTKPDRSSVFGQTILKGGTVHIADVLEDPDYARPEAQKLTNLRAALGVPLLRDGHVFGVVSLFRTTPRPFTQRQIELAETFADQAVIAIENVRLFEAEQQRTRELSESLEQQTATSEVLRAISNSPGELEPVFQAILTNTLRLCGAGFGNLLLFDGKDMRVVAMRNAPPEFVELRRKNPVIPLEKSILGPLVRTKKVSHVADITVEEPYASSPLAKTGHARTAVGIPITRDGLLIGAIGIYLQEVRPFTDKQIELLKNFAAQAVIAIENTRLLSELRESLQQQTATADVLRVISSSPGQLEPVFNAMLENAVRICEAKFGVMFRYDGAFRLVASRNVPAAYEESLRQRGKFQPDAGAPLYRLIQTKELVQTADELAEPNPGPAARIGGARSLIAIPMRKENDLIGAFVIFRTEIRPFSNKQIELVQNFANQAVIAIENARLLNELRRRTTDLTKSLDDLRTAQDRLVQTEKLASLGQLTAGIAHEIKNPLNFVNNFSSISVELIDELRQALAGANLDDKLHAQINEIADMLQGNLDKVVQHGKRADSIVKNMLLHSRQGSGEHRPVGINSLVEESLNLAYHGARAEKQGFNITLERSFDPATGEVDVFPQDITRVLLNLISNGFYAATKRKADANGGDFEPVLSAATKSLGDSVEIRIRDNGIGIPPEVKEKIFNPFFTTKPAGEGTGLGLSISHDVIVKQHGGSIEVDTKLGEFTEFRIVLPRGAATIAKSGERP